MTDTIYALSSGSPPAAIAIIRISGPDASTALLALTGNTALPPRRARLSRVHHPLTGSLLDTALVLYFPGPNTATGEDLAELHLHGGRAVVRAVEDALHDMPGLRGAEPGEFTRRAFEHGRIDLNEADGLADLLAAETEMQRRAAIDMASGHFSARLSDWRDALIRIAALVEADLDFSDEGDVGESLSRHIRAGLTDVHRKALAMCAMPAAEKLREGIEVVLAGPPNSGKSTLLNALVQREAAIVSEIAGTTRDLIRVPVSFGGIAFTLTDTAGLRDDSSDAIERIGIERAAASIATADVLLWLGQEGEGPRHPHLVEIEAQCDRNDHGRKTNTNVIRLSARTGEGIDQLISYLIRAARELMPPDNGFAINQRQRACLRTMANCLAEAIDVDDMVIVGELVRQAREALDQLTGQAGTEEVLDVLFGRFCIGK